MVLSRKIFFYAFLAIVAVLLIVRFSGLLAFPIFNDEAIYIQYSQLMADNFSKFKFISIDNVFHDWKPPLQYWLGAVAVNWFVNPLLGVRLLSVFFWLLGAVGIYLLAVNFWGRKEGWLSALFYALNPSIFFYGGQFIAEVYVWTAAIWLFVCLVGLMKRPIIDLRLGLLLGGLAAGAGLLLFKQAGFLYFYLAWFLPLFYFSLRRPAVSDKKALNSFLSARRLWRRNALTAWGVLAGSFIIYKLIIPAELFSLEKQFTGRWTLGFGEILSWPAEIWSANLSLVWDIFQYYYSPAVLFLVIAFVFLAFWRKQREEIIVGAMFWLSSLAVIFGLRGFNEYLYHTATIVFLILMLGRFGAYLSYFWKLAGWRKFLAGLGLATIFFVAIFWILQICILKESPAAFLDRGTSWLRGNNFLSWANGFNVPILVEMLKKQPDPSIAFVDPQWGNPGTALQVFRGYYPQVRIEPIIPDLLRPEFAGQLSSAGFRSRLAIFSKKGNAPETRKQ